MVPPPDDGLFTHAVGVPAVRELVARPRVIKSCNGSLYDVLAGIYASPRDTRAGLHAEIPLRHGLFLVGPDVRAARLWSTMTARRHHCAHIRQLV
jgi:hypothetical protein